MIEKNKTYSRRDDMSQKRTLNVFIESDGDICVFVGEEIGKYKVSSPMKTYNENEDIAYASVEFVAMGGGMRSPHTRDALINLIKAIQKDNKENPT